jgi:hypothetical protein
MAQRPRQSAEPQAPEPPAVGNSEPQSEANGGANGEATHGANGDADADDAGPKLEPVRTVKRELISPAGHKVLVDVPVYPPFRLERRPEKKPPERRRGKSARPPKGDTGS